MGRFEATGSEGTAFDGGTSCVGVLEHLEAFVDGDLVAAEAAAIEDHLEGSPGGGQVGHCPACVAEHRLASAVRRELRALPELDAPPAVLREITRSAQRARFRKPSRRVPTRRRAWTRLAAAMLATVMLGAALWWGIPRQAPAEPSAIADPARVAQATAEARYALAYLTRVNRRAGLKLRDDLFVDRVAKPAARGLSRSLSPHPGRDVGGTASSDTANSTGSESDRS